MVIFYSYVPLPEGIYSPFSIFLYTWRVQASRNWEAEACCGCTKPEGVWRHITCQLGQKGNFSQFVQNHTKHLGFGGVARNIHIQSERGRGRCSIEIVKQQNHSTMNVSWATPKKHYSGTFVYLRNVGGFPSNAPSESAPSLFMTSSQTTFDWKSWLGCFVRKKRSGNS